MKFLVCGGAGFIGTTFIQNHSQLHPEDEIVNLDNLSIGSSKINSTNLENYKNYNFVKDTITNQTVIDSLVKDSDYVINFAAETHVDRSISNPKSFVETNVLGISCLLDSIRKYDKFFVNVSTDEVYGSAENKSSFTETSILNPGNPYSATKASGDHLVSSYHRTYGIRCITTRCTNNFGPFQFPEKLIPKTIICAMKNLKIPLYDGGHQIRSWIYVVDHVSAIENLLQKGKSGEIYNITAWNEISNREIVEKILLLMKKPLDLIEKVGDRPGHDARYSIDSSKINRETGWEPKFEFDQALELTVNWYLNNSSWWEPFADEHTLHPQPWTQI